MAVNANRKEYRLFSFDSAGRVIRVATLMANSDVEAIEHAKRKHLPYGGELWYLAKIIGRIEAAEDQKKSDKH